MINYLQNENRLILLLRLGAFLCLAGWTWNHFYFTNPIDVLFWTEGTYRLYESMGGDWASFTGTGANDGFVANIMKFLAWVFLICAIGTLTVRKTSTHQMGILWLGSFMLTVLSYALYIDKKRQLPMFIEHGGQMLMPILLYAALYYGVKHHITVRIAIVAFIMTFAGHGAYALNLWPTPGNFTAMTTIITGWELRTIKVLLYTAGVLDVLICLAIFYKKFRVPAAIYAALWGLATALARPMSGMSTDLIYFGADHHIHQFVLRAPHIIIPLYLAILWSKSKAEAPAMAAVEDAMEPTEKKSKQPKDETEDCVAAN